MSTPNLIVSNPKLLNAEDFVSIRGTALYEAMFRNRMTVYSPEHIVRSGRYDENIANRFKFVQQRVSDWLAENCHGFYHLIDRKPKILVFIERDADAVHFKMTFHDAPEPMAPPLPPASTSVAPSQIIQKNRLVKFQHNVIDPTTSWKYSDEDKAVADRVKKMTEEITEKLLISRQKQ